jgi:hypothetical protein
MARFFLDFFAVPPTQVEAIDLNRPPDGSVNRPYLFFRLTQNDDVANQVAQMRLCLGGGESVAANEYRLDDLLSQMAAAFQHRAKTFGTRP